MSRVLNDAQAVRPETREAGYGITLDLLWDVTGSSVDAALEHQLSQAVEAVVLVAVHGEMPDAEALRGLSVPVIALDGFVGDETPTAGVDPRAVAEVGWSPTSAMVGPGIPAHAWGLRTP